MKDPISIAAEKPDYASLEARLATAEKILRAQEKTISVLMDRIQERQRQYSPDFAAFEQNAILQQIVARKTLELKEQNRSLAEAHAQLSRTQAKLLQAQKLESIGQLAAGIAHELNSPIQYVSNNTDFLRESFALMMDVVEASWSYRQAEKEGVVAMEEAARCLDEALLKASPEFLRTEVPMALDDASQGLARVTTIVSAMRRFSYPSGGDKKLADLHEAIQTTMTVSSNEWKYVADIVTEFEPNLPPIPCLVDELSQVFLNLIVNAAHAIESHPQAGQKGKITIRTRLVDGYAEILVADTGPGIPPSIADRVFDPFFTTKPIGKGTGQGLAISHSVVVDKHQGRISFESQEGKGTVFSVQLPIQTE